MPSDRLYRELQSLERKIQVLLSENEKLKLDLDTSKLENEDLKGKLSEQSSRIDGFQNQMKISNIVNNIVDGADSAKLKEEIDGYIRELDKCIAHLAE